MKNKIILFTSPSVAELVDCDVPKAGPGEIIVKTERTTISAGTERALLTGNENVNPYGAPTVKFPRKSGYSSGGTVVEVGADVTDFEVGDRVACSWTNHARYCKVRTERAYKLPDTIGFDEAALVHIATFPLAAIRKCTLSTARNTVVNIHFN